MGTKKPRKTKFFIVDLDEAKLKSAGLLEMRGQCQVVLTILRTVNPQKLLDSRTLTALINGHPDFADVKTPASRVANYFIYRLRIAGCLEYVDEQFYD